MTDANSISVVVPVYNEVDSLSTLTDEILSVAKTQQYDLEIIFVDDGSKDGSWKQIETLAGEFKEVTGVRFRRNFGKAAGLRAGIDQARGDLIVTMDADLQDDPAEIPAMLETLGDDYDVVSGWKKVRLDPMGKRLPSKVFNWLVGWMTGVKLNDHNCGFKAYRREVFDEVKLYGEMHRFVPVLAASRGFRVTEQAVNHRARKHGHSKYGWSRLPKGFLDLLTVSFLTGFNSRPQHVLGGIGLASSIVGSLGMIYLSIYWVLRVTMFADDPNWPPLHQRPLLLYSVVALLLGVQLLCMGFLAELIVKRQQETRDPYSIRQMTRTPLSVHSPDDEAGDPIKSPRAV